MTCKFLTCSPYILDWTWLWIWISRTWWFCWWWMSWEWRWRCRAKCRSRSACPKRRRRWRRGDSDAFQIRKRRLCSSRDLLSKKFRRTLESWRRLWRLSWRGWAIVWCRKRLEAERRSRRIARASPTTSKRRSRREMCERGRNWNVKFFWNYIGWDLLYLCFDLVSLTLIRFPYLSNLSKV